MTTGCEWKKIVTFSLPILLGNLLQQLYNTVDGIVVGNYVSQDALAAVGSCGALAMLFLAACIGLGSGCAVLVSQLFGARLMEDVRRAASTIMTLLGALGALAAVLGFVFSRALLSGLLGVTDEGGVLDMAVTYFSIYSLGLTFQFFYNAVAYILRALGDSRAILWFMCVAAVMNAALDLLFVISFGWEVMGVAVATVISQGVCVAFSVAYMVKRYPLFRYRRREFVFDRKMGVLALRLGLPAMLQQCIISFGNICLQRLVNGFGKSFMAAYTVGIRIENYLFIPVLSINNGMATFTGQNVGAGEPERIKRGLSSATAVSVGVTLALAALVYVFAPEVARLFGVKGESLAMSDDMLHFMTLCFPLFALYLPVMGLLQGSGDTLWSAACSLSSLLVRVIMSYALVLELGFGYQSVWYSLPFGWGLGCVIAWLRYWSGRWRTKAVAGRSVPEEETDL